MTDDFPTWVRVRIQQIKDAGYAAELAARWPPDVPGIKGEHQPTTEEWELIDTEVSYVESAHRLPFVGVDPRKPPEKEPVDFGGGPPVDDAALTDLIYDHLSFIVAEQRRLDILIEVAHRIHTESETK